MAPSAIITEEYTPFSVPNYPVHKQGIVAEARPNGAEYAKQLIGQALRERVYSIDHDTCDVGDEDTFFVADVGEVYRQHLRWKLNLPRVKPHYGEYSFFQWRYQ